VAGFPWTRSQEGTRWDSRQTAPLQRISAQFVKLGIRIGRGRGRLKAKIKRFHEELAQRSVRQSSLSVQMGKGVHHFGTALAFGEYHHRLYARYFAFKVYLPLCTDI